MMYIHTSCTSYVHDTSSSDDAVKNLLFLVLEVHPAMPLPQLLFRKCSEVWEGQKCSLVWAVAA